MADAITFISSLPPSSEVDVTVRAVGSAKSQAERARDYRLRKKKSSPPSRDAVTGGGKGVVCLGSEKEAEKQGEETQIGFNLTGSVGGDRHESSRDAVTVFEMWREETGHAGAKLDRKRQRRIEARLREGFTVTRLCAAIANRKNDPFLMGANDSGRVYDGIETLLRDAAQVERLEALTSPVTRTVTQRQQSPIAMLTERARRMAAGEKQ